MGNSYSGDGDEDVENLNCNKCNSHNTNNDCYWQSHGWGSRPEDVGTVHSDYSKAHIPNHDSYQEEKEHPDDYVQRCYGKSELQIPLPPSPAPLPSPPPPPGHEVAW